MLAVGKRSSPKFLKILFLKKKLPMTRNLSKTPLQVIYIYIYEERIYILFSIAYFSIFSVRFERR